jgi:hypothetical protein
MVRPLLAIPVILFLLIAGLSQSVNKESDGPHIQERYDRFSDLTSIVLDIPIIRGYVDLGGGSVYVEKGSPRHLYLTVIGIFEGTDVAKAIPRVSLIVDSRSANWMYLRGPTLLQVIMDGTKRATLGEMKRYNASVVREGGVEEQLRLDVPFAVVEHLSKAHTLEVRVGSDEFVLSRPQLSDLGEWIKKFPAALGKPTKQ